MRTPRLLIQSDILMWTVPVSSVSICCPARWREVVPSTSASVFLRFRHNPVITRKAVVARRYLCQGKAIRQVASPSSLCQRLPYAPFNAKVTKISKWPRIHDSCRITPKIESLVVYAMPDTPSKFQKDPFITFWVILLTHRQTNRQTDKQTKSDNNITSLAEVIIKRCCVL